MRWIIIDGLGGNLSTGETNNQIITCICMLLCVVTNTIPTLLAVSSTLTLPHTSAAKIYIYFDWRNCHACACIHTRTYARARCHPFLVISQCMHMTFCCFLYYNSRSTHAGHFYTQFSSPLFSILHHVAESTSSQVTSSPSSYISHGGGFSIC